MLYHHVTKLENAHIYDSYNHNTAMYVEASTNSPATMYFM